MGWSLSTWCHPVYLSVRGCWGQRSTQTYWKHLSFLQRLLNFKWVRTSLNFQSLSSPSPSLSWAGSRVKRRGEESSGTGVVSGAADEGFSRRNIRQTVPQPSGEVLSSSHENKKWMLIFRMNIWVSVSMYSIYFCLASPPSRWIILNPPDFPCFTPVFQATTRTLHFTYSLVFYASLSS